VIRVGVLMRQYPTPAGHRTIVEISGDGQRLSLRMELVAETPPPALRSVPRVDERTGLIWFGMAPAERKGG
jgi:hypothetical protein